ncbi:hypothetical protein LEP1GSC083_1450 [Leptospira interrogans serovar Pyrogenes str. L0374]|uniref:Uncharacterized protein n=1 Tax=Leptospira interrogans serovar Pyrogenes str. L0374 TaxID=1049928 RepID=M6K939_LEPIR|nr:hypothetical protein LEP1GSC083_1450 [Leptospira interrogans serovar Pyrogenes str. L0374]
MNLSLKEAVFLAHSIREKFHPFLKIKSRWYFLLLFILKTFPKY